MAAKIKAHKMKGTDIMNTLSIHDKLQLLRDRMQQHHLDAYLIPRSDRFQGEEVTPEDERLHWVTNFTGSAGCAIVTTSDAALFVDSRYSLIAVGQTDLDHIQVKGYFLKDQAAFIAQQAIISGKDHFSIGLDPWLTTGTQYNQLEAEVKKALDQAKKPHSLVSFKAISTNLVDAVWEDRPFQKKPSPIALSDDFVGQSAKDKQAKAKAWLRQQSCDALYCFLPDQVMWLLNWRGRDLKGTPFFQSYALIQEGGMTIYCQPQQMNEAILSNIPDFLTMKRLDQLDDDAIDLAQQQKKIALSYGAAPLALLKHFESLSCFAHIKNTEQAEPAADAINGQEFGGSAAHTHKDTGHKSHMTQLSMHPVELWKACKNITEQDHIRRSHIRDGLAVARFLYWLETAIHNDEEIDEDAADKRLLRFRQDDPKFITPSFESCSAAGPNAAMPHYRARPETNRVIGKHDMYKIDSGGQYEDGTTDITRTVAFMPQNQERIDRYTRVLKGHIAVARAKVPAGTACSIIDGFARQALWQAGQDFGHGTGHGVGFCLGVHEGPFRLSPACSLGLMAGTFLSNEPGFYKDGDFGIRIENLILTQPFHRNEDADANDDNAADNAGKPSAAEANTHNEPEFLCFETVSFCPIDTSMVDVKMLTYPEKKWLNDYHQKTFDLLSQAAETMGTEEKQPGFLAWLRDKTQPVTA
jgi:Xaa-Pro aminopeptidase